MQCFDAVSCFYHIFLSLCFLGPAVKKGERNNEVKLLSLTRFLPPSSRTCFCCRSLHSIPLSHFGHHAFLCTLSPLSFYCSLSAFFTSSVKAESASPLARM